MGGCSKRRKKPTEGEWEAGPVWWDPQRMLLNSTADLWAHFLSGSLFAIPVRAQWQRWLIRQTNYLLSEMFGLDWYVPEKKSWFSFCQNNIFSANLTGNISAGKQWQSRNESHEAYGNCAYKDWMLTFAQYTLFSCMIDFVTFDICINWLVADQRYLLLFCQSSTFLSLQLGSYLLSA